MKTIYKIMLLILVGFTLSSCSKDNIKEFGVVTYRTNLMGELTGEIIFSNTNYPSNISTTVYHYNQRKKTLQLQPHRIGDTIFNVDTEWFKIDSIESQGIKNVLYYDEEIEGNNKFAPLNDEGVEVFKITYKTEFFNMINITEIFVIDLTEITNIDYNYKVM